MIRVLHVSDVHVDVPLHQIGLAWWLPRREWVSKRVLGGLNLRLNRSRHFRNVANKLRDLDDFRRKQRIDLVLCTGDYTVLGTDPELAAARAAIAPLTEAPLGFVTVPGNHDVYTSDSVGRFERHFEGLLETDWPEHRVDGTWPIVRLVGDTVAVVAVNSARPNPQPWRSSGYVPEAQLEALGRILCDSRLAGRFVFVMTHYAPRLADGRPDRFTHGLINANALLRTVAQVPRGAVLHGHVHRCYSVRVPGVAPLLVGAGSSTQRGSEGLWVFDVGDDEVRLTRGAFVHGAYRLVGEPKRIA